MGLELEMGLDGEMDGAWEYVPYTLVHVFRASVQV